MPNDRVTRRQTSPVPVFLGHSAPTRQVQALIHRALSWASPVLVSGESGTGKRTVAEILHHYADEPSVFEWVPANAGGLEDRLKREPTGGSAQLIYLGPIEALSLAEQATLPALLGARRVVLATRIDPASPERARLDPGLLGWAGLHIQLPTLRDRIEDLDALALRIVCETPSRRPIGGINDYALDCLRTYPWPGNVTELEQVLRYAIEVGGSEQIELRDLPPALRLHAIEQLDLDAPDFDFSLAHATRTAIERAMRYARGNKRKAAKLLQIGKTTLYRKLDSYDVNLDP